MLIPMAIVAFLAMSTGCSGQRYVEVRVLKDGADHFTVSYGVSDSLKAPEILLAGADRPLLPEKASDARSDESDDLTLTGDLQLEVVHVRQLMASYKLTEIHLTRDSTDGSLSLSRNEINRILSGSHR